MATTSTSFDAHSNPIIATGVARINATKIQPTARVFSFCESGMCKIGRLLNPTPESNVQAVRTSRRNQPLNIGPGGWGNNHKNNYTYNLEFQ